MLLGCDFLLFERGVYVKNGITLPEAFLRRMERQLGEYFPAFLASYEKEPERALFLLSERISPEEFERTVGFPVERLPYLRNGYRLTAEKPGNDPLHHAGAFYVQDPSAMATVSSVLLHAVSPHAVSPHAAPLKKGMRCLDLCAAPGGKTVQLAAAIGCMLGEDGFLVSNEFQPARCKVLCSNIERMGFANVLISNADPVRVAKWYPAYFDLTLVDAPCSGEGMFRKDPRAVSEWSEGAPAFCAERQIRILREAAKTVAPGGYLLYSTCTFSEEENEGVARTFLTEHPAFSLCDLPEELQSVTVSGSFQGSDLPQARRWYPHIAPGEGQFFVLFQRNAGASDDVGGREMFPAFPDARQPLTAEELDAVTSFLEENLLAEGDLTLCKLKSGQIISADFPVPAENVFAAGVTLGTVEKPRAGARFGARFAPHHQLFKALGSRFLRKIELSYGDERVKKYLSGAEIPCDCGDGWAVVTVCGCVLGGAKVSGGVAKNHYPKGLRLLPN